MSDLDFALEVDRTVAKLRSTAPMHSGTLVRLVGLRLEARGIMAPIGSCCEVLGQFGQRIEAEVVGFSDKTLYLMPFSEPVGIGPGALVRILTRTGQVSVGPELLGRVIDGRGEPLDDGPKPQCSTRLGLRGLPLNPMERGPINGAFASGTSKRLRRAKRGACTAGERGPAQVPSLACTAKKATRVGRSAMRSAVRPAVLSRRVQPPAKVSAHTV